MYIDTVFGFYGYFFFNPSFLLSWMCKHGDQGIELTAMYIRGQPGEKLTESLRHPVQRPQCLNREVGHALKLGALSSHGVNNLIMLFKM